MYYNFDYYNKVVTLKILSINGDSQKLSLWSGNSRLLSNDQADHYIHLKMSITN